MHMIVLNLLQAKLKCDRNLKEVEIFVNALTTNLNPYLHTKKKRTIIGS